MSYGITLMRGTASLLADTAAKAEAAGFGTAWTPEFYTRSAVVTLAAMAERTNSARVGTGIAYAVGRSPLVLATEARTLDELSGGRLVLGLGTGTKRMMEDWHGVDGSGPASRIEELIPLLREIWRLHEEPVSHEGRFYSTRITPTAEITEPTRTEIPVFTAGVSPRMVESAGRVADGQLGHPLFTRKYVEDVVIPEIEKGKSKRGREDAHVERVGIVITSIHDDPEVARRECAAQLGFYAAPRTYGKMLELSGFGAEAEAIQTAFAARDFEAMTAAVTDEMIDEMCAAGTAEEVAAKLREKAELFDHVVVYPPSFLMSDERSDELPGVLVDRLDPLLTA